MKYRSMVPLNSARDVERPEQRVRLHRLSADARTLANRLGIWDGDTISQVRARVEQHMKLMNAEQRRNLLAAIASCAL